MEAHLTPDCRMPGWQIPAYDNGKFIGYIHLILGGSAASEYYANARFVEESEIEIHDRT